MEEEMISEMERGCPKGQLNDQEKERGFHSSTMEEEMISEMARGCLKGQLNDQEKERGFHSSTMEEEMISEMERGCLKGQLNDQDMSTTETKKDLATKIAEAIKLNEGEEAVRGRWNKNSIYKVPAPLAAVNTEAFAPKMVSMGPYHHGEDQLKPMEVQKHRAALCFILKSKKSIEDYIEALWKVLPDLMDSYSQLSHTWREKDHRRRFLTLMLIDGCFLLEMLNVYNNKFDGYEENDPFFSSKGTTSNPQIAIDLMMLENQVPFTAIETLLTVQNGETERDESCKQINNLIFNAMLQKPRPEPDQRIRGLHMLDIVRKVLVLQDEYVVGEDSMTEGQKLSWRLMGRHLSKQDTHHRRSKKDGATKSVSVMELRHAGVEFKVANDDWHSSIKFEKNGGALTIPINRTIESEVLVYNMVAFELLHPLKFPSTLCYYTFMNGLLNSVADVKHLRTVGIIRGAEKRDYVILKIFKKLVLVNIPMNKCRELNQIQDDLNEFYKSRKTGCKGKFLELVALWKNIWTPNLKQTFIKHPWKFISVVAAAILMALTIAQTYYAARSYRDSSHK